jgi:hypothetical protein
MKTCVFQRSCETLRTQVIRLSYVEHLRQGGVKCGQYYHGGNDSSLEFMRWHDCGTHFYAERFRRLGWLMGDVLPPFCILPV